MTVQALALQRPIAAAPMRERPVRDEVRPQLRLVRDDEVAQPVRLRLTARGRLVRTLAVCGALSLLALMAWARLTAPVLPPTHAVTVESGQTLTQIAAEELPMVPLQAAVVRIQSANGLNSTAVVAGQDLIIPGESD